MKIEDHRKFEYCCQDAQELLTLLLVCPEELTIDERSEIARHLNECPDCREDYEGMLQTSEVLIASRDYLRNSGVFGNMQIDRGSIQMSHEEIMEKRFQDRLERVVIRRKRWERKEKIAKFKHLVKQISAIAACLVVGFGLFFAINQLSRDNDSVSPIVSNQRNSVKIELISGNSSEIIPAGRLIAATDCLKTLRINGNRQMVLNIGTELSIQPYNLGCVVRLDKGEIYTEVEHDGRPFVVETSHGRAVITGTSFNIKADDGKMDLAVVEGTVRFESEKGTVDVAGGYQSSIVASLQPTKPVSCDALQITKWARKQWPAEPVQMDISTKEDISELAELPLADMPYCDLEDINFDVWIDQHRDWFEREFPWTKKLQNLLAQDGIEVDTISLLIRSGDLWRFAWPEYSQQRVLAEDRYVIQEVANQYGIEIDNLVLVEMVQNKQASSIKAFEGWLDALDKKKSNVIIDSIHAMTFLLSTRSLAWFAVNGDHIQIQDKQQVLGLLTEQVAIASDSLGTLNQMLLADKSNAVCSVAQYDEYIKSIQDDISVMAEIERELIGDKVVSK